MNYKKAIFKLKFDCGRNGELEGVFISSKEQVQCLMEKRIEVDFGECLGKHSHVYGPIDDGEIVFVSDSEEVVDLFTKHDLTTGFNPFHHQSIDFDFEEHGLVDNDQSVLEIVNELLEKNKDASIL